MFNNAYNLVSALISNTAIMSVTALSSSLVKIIISYSLYLKYYW